MKLGYMARNQYGETFHLKTDHPRAELMKLVGYKSAKKIYRDCIDGRTEHVGWIVGPHWFSVYQVHSLNSGVSHES